MWEQVRRAAQKVQDPQLAKRLLNRNCVNKSWIVVGILLVSVEQKGEH